jgi:formylglycine-generating enzyme required for sulfatase activity
VILPPTGLRPGSVLLSGFLLLSVGITFAQTVGIPGGIFTMGKNDGSADELPVHEVSLTPFSISRYEITEAAYDSCVQSGRCTAAHYNDSTCRAWNGKRFIQVKVPPSARNRDYPVVCVTWLQAREYCRSRGMELPTEAQWEYAARSGGTAVPGAMTAPSAVAGRKVSPEAVGSGTPNGWGLHDMLGNAWEWVNDYYDVDAYAFSEPGNPKGPDAGIYRVIRGGGWYSSRSSLSITDRNWYSPGYSEVSIGFRCVGK